VEARNFSSPEPLIPESPQSEAVLADSKAASSSNLNHPRDGKAGQVSWATWYRESAFRHDKEYSVDWA